MPAAPKPPFAANAPDPGARPITRPQSAPSPVDSGSKTKDLLQAAPKLELPKGGGAIRGMGEKFQANPVTGSGSFSVPIPTPAGRNGFGPSLALSYDSGSGNGIFGLGWSLPVPAVRRKTDRGLPTYTDSDTFVLSDAEDLVACEDLTDSGGYTRKRYRPRVESSPMWIERWQDPATQAIHWRTWSPQNVRRIYGLTTRLTHPTIARKAFEWPLEEEQDELGNRIVYDWSIDTGSGITGIAEQRRAPRYLRLDSVRWGNLPDATYRFKVALTYAVRQDPFSRFRAGFDVRCYRICTQVEVQHRLTAGETYTTVSTLTPAYAESPVVTTLTGVQLTGTRDSVTASLPAMAFTYQAASQASAPAFVTGIEDLPGGIDFSRAQWVDLDGEGMSGILAEVGSQWLYKRNEGGGRLAPFRRLPNRPSPPLGSAQLVDVDADGRLEMVVRAPGMSGYFTRTDTDGWEGFRPFKGIPSEQGRSIDLDGDGLPDVLVAGPTGLRWYQAAGADGWTSVHQAARPTDEDQGPTVLYATDNESVFLVDLTGDGLLDVVRVWNGNVCYWPNLGFGRFAPKVQMANAPWFDRRESFDPRRVRFADIDGAGPADLIYLGPTEVRWWPNRSGNGWGEEHTIAVSVEDPVTVSFADLTGNGTQCLVWASPLMRDRYAPLRYVKLMSAGKPYLMTSLDNGMGRTTTLTYTPSTSYYLADRRAGTPWATRLNFPVQCLSQVNVTDAVTGWSFTTETSYHHGYFDGPEREFRGFGMVETRDTETVPRGTNTFPAKTVVTRTWFHTGAWKQAETLEDAYAAQWFNTAPPTPLVGLSLGRCVVPSSLSTTDERAAYRALKGKPLRVEVYADDGNSDPYTVTASNYTVLKLTTGVFRTDARETATWHYERNTADPRVQHDLVLDVDTYGNVTLAAKILYSRSFASLATATAEQDAAVAIVSETQYASFTAADGWHPAAAWRKRGWELSPDDLDLGTQQAVTVLKAAFDAGAAVDFDIAVTVGHRRLLSDQVTTFASDADATVAAADGAVGVRALVSQAYARAFTAAQVADSAGLGAIHDLDMAHGGYVQRSGDDGWWVPSGVPTYDTANFYVITLVTDPFGQPSSVTWDADKLLPQAVVDALGNTVTASYDLIARQPVTVTDPNGSLNTVVFDALNRVVEVYVRSATVEGVYQGDPDGLPSVEFTYDLSTVPVSARQKQRANHGDADTRHEQVAYSDGGGNPVQVKVKVREAVDAITEQWVGNGRVIVDQKGNPIKQFEPFFSDTDDWEPEAGFDGVSALVTYDPLGRATRIDLPNGTCRRTTFTPWVQRTYDENDCAGDADVLARASETVSESDPTLTPEAATLLALIGWAADHVDTPTTVTLDVQGRPYTTDEMPESGTHYTTTVTLDLVGNPTLVTDARGNPIQTQTFDMLGRPIFTHSADGGDVTSLLDIAGQAIFLLKSGTIGIETEVDALRRKLRTWEWATPSGAAWTKILRERFVYGEGVTGAVGLFLLGRLYRIYDTAGKVEVAYDWKGQTAATTRTFLTNNEDQGNWSGIDTVYPYNPDTPDDATAIAALETAAASLLDDSYLTADTFDAVGRIVTHITPDDAVTTNTYDVAGRLQTVTVTKDSVNTLYVASITYNPKGQRLAITYGNEAVTSYTYDPDTFRLATLVTTRPVSSTRPTGLQSLGYTYDPVGNIVAITNDADDVVYYDNTAVTPDQAFVYDALYRLKRATGREKGDRVQPWSSDPAFLDIPNTEALRNYIELYTYDQVGNIAQMVHKLDPSTVLWTRTYGYASGSNRLLTTTETAGTVTYVHDDRGNIVYLPPMRYSGTNEANIEVTYRDQMAKVYLNDSDTSFYFYDSAGQRVRKVVKTGPVQDRKYVGGFEVWTKRDSGGTLLERRETLHVMDDQARIAMIETKTAGTGAPLTRVRYQLGNQIGTACVEVNEDAEVITYEEYHPYGSTAWWSNDGDAEVSRKRYRYTGMERDEETGLQCHGVRHYAPWLARWTSADPIGLGDGVNRYAYCHGGPVGGRDGSGLGTTQTAASVGGAEVPITVVADLDSNPQILMVDLPASLDMDRDVQSITATPPPVAISDSEALKRIRAAAPSVDAQAALDGYRASGTPTYTVGLTISATILTNPDADKLVHNDDGTWTAPVTGVTVRAGGPLFTFFGEDPDAKNDTNGVPHNAVQSGENQREHESNHVRDLRRFGTANTIGELLSGTLTVTAQGTKDTRTFHAPSLPGAFTSTSTDRDTALRQISALRDAASATLTMQISNAAALYTLLAEHGRGYTGAPSQIAYEPLHPNRLFSKRVLKTNLGTASVNSSP